VVFHLASGRSLVPVANQGLKSRETPFELDLSVSRTHPRTNASKLNT